MYWAEKIQCVSASWDYLSAIPLVAMKVLRWARWAWKQNWYIKKAQFLQHALLTLTVWIHFIFSEFIWEQTLLISISMFPPNATWRIKPEIVSKLTEVLKVLCECGGSLYVCLFTSRVVRTWQPAASFRGHSEFTSSAVPNFLVCVLQQGHGCGRMRHASSVHS